MTVYQVAKQNTQYYGDGLPTEGYSAVDFHFAKEDTERCELNTDHDEENYSIFIGVRNKTTMERYFLWAINHNVCKDSHIIQDRMLTVLIESVSTITKEQIIPLLLEAESIHYIDEVYKVESGNLHKQFTSQIENKHTNYLSQDTQCKPYLQTKGEFEWMIFITSNCDGYYWPFFLTRELTDIVKQEIPLSADVDFDVSLSDVWGKVAIELNILEDEENENKIEEIMEKVI